MDPLLTQRRARVPPIDISTDLENPPAFAAIVPLRAEAGTRSTARPTSPAAAPRAPDLAPLTLPEPSGQVFARPDDGGAPGLGDRQGRCGGGTDRGHRHDAVVRVRGRRRDTRHAVGVGDAVDLRSVSRVGRSDIGTNAERIRDFLAALQEP